MHPILRCRGIKSCRFIPFSSLLRAVFSSDPLFSSTVCLVSLTVTEQLPGPSVPVHVQGNLLLVNGAIHQQIKQRFHFEKQAFTLSFLLIDT